MFALLLSNHWVRIRALLCHFTLLVVSRKNWILTLQKTRRLPFIAELLMLCCKNCIKHISVYLNTVKQGMKKPHWSWELFSVHYGEAALTWSLEILSLSLASADMHFAFFESRNWGVCFQPPQCLPCWAFQSLSTSMAIQPMWTCHSTWYQEAYRYLCKVKNEVAFIPSSKIYCKQIYFSF